jgi:hypothetical protein
MKEGEAVDFEKVFQALIGIHQTLNLQCSNPTTSVSSPYRYSPNSQKTVAFNPSKCHVSSPYRYSPNFYFFLNIFPFFEYGVSSPYRYSPNVVKINPFVYGVGVSSPYRYSPNPQGWLHVEPMSLFQALIGIHQTVRAVSACSSSASFQALIGIHQTQQSQP